jgi:hypothetical protein
MKYVLVTGGVVSGLGKGVTASSIGVLLKACGLRVTFIKIGNFPRPSPRAAGRFSGPALPAAVSPFLFLVKTGTERERERERAKKITSVISFVMAAT